MPEYSPAENFILSKLRKELAPTLTYHGIHHTLDVLNAAISMGTSEGISDKGMRLLRIAACYHDAGFLYQYKGHEEKSCEMAKRFLPAFGFDNEEIEIVCGMIKATKLPQKPQTQLERILADSDLDYLGREDFLSIGKTLYHEFRIYLHIKDEQQWNRIQLDFLNNHQYHTEFCRQYREPGKRQRLQEIEAIVNSYGAS